MKVILKQDVEKLGRRGDLVEVADGYGRNFLIPRGLAVEATEAKLREWKSIQEGKAVREKRSEEEARAKKKNLQGKRITVKMSAGEKGRLFGSVTTAQLAEAIEEQLGIKVDKKLIKIEENIKQIGVFPFKVRLYPGVEAELSVKVEAG